MLFALLMAAQILAKMPMQANGAPLASIAAVLQPRGAEATVTLDMTIAADGALERCDVVERTGSGNLANAVCAAFRRSGFTPAP